MLHKLNHIGIAVSDMENSKNKYIQEGYKIIKENYDENFLTDLCLMQKENECIELVYTNNKESTVFNLCSKNTETIYHKCYEVKDINKTILDLKNEKYILVSKIVFSKLLCGKVCFLYSKQHGLIELLEV